MKADRWPWVLISTACLCLPVKTSHAQGNLLAGTNWTIQENDLGYVFPTITSNGDFSVSFAFLGAGDVQNYPLAGTIIQTIATTPGTTYDLTFQAIQYDGITASSVAINDDLLANFTRGDPFISPINNFGGGPFNTSWYGFAYNFTASSADTTISFFEEPESYYYPADDDVFWSDSGLDDISATEAPEPSSLALLGSGLAGRLACTWPKTRKILSI